MDQSVSQDQDASMDASAGEPAAAMARTSSARRSISRERVNSDDEKSSRVSFSIKITPTEEKGAAEIEDQEGGTSAAFVETAAEVDAATSAAESSMSTRATSSSPTRKVDGGVAEKRVLELEALLVEAREAVDKESARADRAQNDAWRELSKDVTAAKELAAAAELKVAGAEKNAATAEKRVKVLEAEAKVATATTIKLRMTATTAKEDLKKSEFAQQTATEKGGQATGELEGLRRRLEESEKKGEKGEANLAEERRKRDAVEMKLEDATKEWAADRERLEERVTAAQATTSAAATSAAAPSEVAGSQADGGTAGSVDEVEWDAKVQAVKDMLTQVKGYLHNQGDLVRKMQKSLQ
jgi:vacuolar-type H+-ATPase subunit I/STV1